jgi:hypothetical protein
MKIAIIIEGKTEQAFLSDLRAFMKTRLADRMPKLVAVPQNGRIPRGDALKRLVEGLLTYGKEPADTVIALPDVYTGTNPPDFVDAADATAKMRQWVGPNPDFYPHAAQFDFRSVATPLLARHPATRWTQPSGSGPNTGAGEP